MKEKNKSLYIIGLVSVFFIGVIGTLITLKSFNLLEKEVTTKTISEVNITESDTLKTAIEKVYDSAIYVESYQGNTASSSGSGFVYKQDDNYGYILTNHHVIEDATKIEITNNNGDTCEATLLGSDEYSDVAVLRIDKKYVLQVATLGSSENANLGDTVFTVGSPLGKTYMGTVTKGILSGKDRSVTTSNQYVMEVLQVDAALNSGNSGGPLVNINGEVIGINTMKLVQTSIEGMGFAIPIELVKTILDKLESGTKIERPVLGVTMIDLTSTYQLYRYGINVDESVTSGVAVADVSDNSPASNAGITKGDVITHINDTEITSTAVLRSTLYKYNVGDTITVTINRNGTVKKIDVKLDTVLENS